MEEDINLLDYLKILLGWKRFIAVITSLGALIGLVVSLWMPNIYMANATLLPLTGVQGGGLGAALGAVQSLGGVLGGLGGGSTSSQIMSLLKSQTLAEKIINKYDLMKAFYPSLWDESLKQWRVHDVKDLPNMESAVLLLKAKVSFKENLKEKVINISAQDKSPQFAADLVNAYIRELANHINENAFTVAKRNRIFIEGQLERNKTELLELGRELSKFYSNNRVSNVTPNLDVSLLNSPSELQGRTEEDVLGGVADVPQPFQKMGNENLESLSETQNVVKKVVQDIPQQAYLQYLTFQRESLRQINTLLIQQFEISKIDEVKEELRFQVIDAARVPVARFKPKRRMVALSFMVGAGFLSLVFVFCVEYLKKAKVLS